jgi:Ser/Thr protein kinase RdoA (MazF antagonist)
VSTATGDLATDLALIDATLERVGRLRLAPPAPLDSGRNHNYRVETAPGPLCVRIHRHTRGRERIELGLAALQHAAARGIPVAAPLTAGGAVLFEVDGRFTSVYPWIEAKSHTRFALERHDAAAVGQVHGRLMRAIESFRDSALKPATELYWDAERSLSDLARLEAVLRRDGVPGFDSAVLLTDIAVQRRHIESGVLARPSDFDAIGRQPIHGDIHEGNVLIASDGTVAAVIDWDMVAIGPPLYEVIRALDFTHALDDPDALEAYLAAYAAEAPYSAADAEAIVNLWAASTVHNTWSFRALLLEGDRRVDPFIPAHRHRIRQFTDPAYRAWLKDCLTTFASD